MSNTYTKYQRREIAKVFKSAQEYLWDGVLTPGYKYQPEFICKAIYGLYCNAIAGIRAREIIMERIAPFTTFDAWLVKCAKIHRKDLTTKRVQQHRKDWLEILYKEFSHNPKKEKH